jgi:FKBP-type peptidyl-prolyl cis-trans isomerase
MSEDDDYGIPRHMIHAFQIHREKFKDEQLEDEIDFTYYQRNFHVGSLVNFSVQSASPSLEANDEDWSLIINPASFHIGQGSRLCIDTVSIDPANVGMNSSNMTLFVSSDVNPDYTPLCPFISYKNPTVTSLGLQIVGPSLLRFALVNHSDSEDFQESNNDSHQMSINLFGRVELVSDEEQQVILQAKTRFLDLEEKEAAYEDSEGDDELDKSEEDEQNYQRVHSPANQKSPKIETLNLDRDKRKLNKLSTETCVDEETEEPVKLTKKQRKMLAKQKETELQEALAKEHNHSKVSEKHKTEDPLEQKQSLTKPRMLNGVLVQDIVHGTGATVKVGRKVSIHYVGRLVHSDKIFDKNSSKSNPLTFRVGNGEVIKGLERGIEKMRVGGERILKIPSALAYGRKGSGDKIPPNADLQFEVKIISSGGH